MAITLKTLYNSITPIIKCSPNEMNVFVVEGLQTLSSSNVTVYTNVTLEDGLSVATNVFDVPSSYLYVKAVYVDGEEIGISYDQTEFVSTLSYYFDNEMRQIIFNYDLDVGSVITADVETFIDQDLNTYTSSTSLAIPNTWINALKYYVIAGLFTMEKYFDVNRSLFYTNKYKEFLAKLKDKSNLGESFMDLGDTL